MTFLQFLLQAGGDPLLVNEKGHTCIEYAKETEIKTLLAEAILKGEEFRRRLDAEERRRFPLEERLKQFIVGQEAAINTVAGAIRRHENGW